MKNKKIIYILIVVIVCFVSFFIYTSKAQNIRIDNSTYSYEYEDGIYVENIASHTEMPEGSVGTRVGLFYDGVVVDIGKGQVIYRYDTSIPMVFEAGTFGENKHAQLTVYYDYMPVKFKVGTSDEYVYSYNFDVEENKAVFIPITLDENIPKDENMHTVTFVYGGYTDLYAKDFEYVHSGYGTSISYNLKYYEDVESSTMASTYSGDIYSGEQPNNIYYYEAGPEFQINTDYFGFYEDFYRSPMEPAKLMQVSSGQTIPLMYNIYNEGSAEDCLFFIQLNGEPVLIDGKPFKVINDLPQKGFCNGLFTIQAPEEKGLYELTGYLVYDPFKPQEVESHIPQSSRFTIEVL